jgi:hypothetical protein
MPKTPKAVKLKKAQIDMKSDLIVAAVKAAANREGVSSFIFAHWEDNDASKGSAITSLQNITPRQAVNLCLLAAEQAINIDLRQAEEKGYPPEYSAIMKNYVANIVECSRIANQALLDLNAKRERATRPEAVDEPRAAKPGEA